MTPLLILTGATASGKSALAVAWAERHGGEILSMDSMAVYRRMDIGTAKPDADQRARVPHWLIDLVEPNESFDTSRWCSAADAKIAEVRARGKVPLVVGGTPLYLISLLKGMAAGVPADRALRAELEAREHAAAGSLHEELASRDPESAARIHRNDTKRLVRALEVITVTGKPLHMVQEQWTASGSRYDAKITALAVPREELHARIKVRTATMLAQGLVEETRAIASSGGFSREAAAAIGYAQCLDWLAGKLKDEEELRNMIRRATHALVRRQATWLRRMREIRWLPGDTRVERLEQEFAPGPSS